MLEVNKVKNSAMKTDLLIELPPGHIAGMLFPGSYSWDIIQVDHKLDERTQKLNDTVCIPDIL